MHSDLYKYHSRRPVVAVLGVIKSMRNQIAMHFLLARFVIVDASHIIVDLCSMFRAIARNTSRIPTIEIWRKVVSEIRPRYTKNHLWLKSTCPMACSKRTRHDRAFDQYCARWVHASRIPLVVICIFLQLILWNYLVHWFIDLTSTIK